MDAHKGVFTVTDDLQLSVSSDDREEPVAAADRAPVRERFTPILKLKIALGVALLAVAALGVVIFLDHRQTTDEQAVAEAIEAYTAAWNDHDLPAVLAAMSHGAGFAAGESLEHPLVTTTAGSQEFERLLDALFTASVSLETVGGVTVVMERFWRATVPQRYRYQVHGMRVVENGVSLFTLIRENGRMKITQHVWWRPLAPVNPSMLWATSGGPN
jgi:hypothetical protein